ncbi:MAG: ABC transporter permease [Microbacterium sp.]|uniref:ABC transporter permease n=2 Tax=Microbacterium sp. TaxID=51671 RepID=UPI001ACD8972|nr:ABC transporter permease [Microbacterium sp.]MBN9153525.1 ABC transporter permease [Microbacterium sp.]
MVDLISRPRARTRRWTVQSAVGGTIVAVVILAAVVGPLLSPWPPNATDVLASLEPPSLRHWMGTDSVGRDVLTRSLVGAQISLVAGVAVTAAALAIGTVIGSIVAYAGGWLDAAVSRVVDTAIAIPFLVVVLATVAILGPGTVSVGVGMVVVGWAVYARIARAEVLALREHEFIMATRSLGYTSARILLRHVVPNVVRPGLTFATMDVVAAMVVLAAMSYLGFGAQPPVADLGSIIAAGQPFLLSAWWISTLPAVILIALGVGVGLIDDGFSLRRKVS